MNLPTPVREEVAAAVGAVEDEVPVTGGSVGATSRITVGGTPFFLKYGRPDGQGCFEAEAAGLAALRSAEGDRVLVPDVVAWRDTGGEWGWILLEWLQPVAAGDAAWERLGSGLAELHRAGRDDGWGWERDGYIGRLPQVNRPAASWAEFWIDRRLGPQLERARPSSAIGKPAEWDRLLARLPDLLAPAESDRPSFIHGDLWRGNVLLTADGPAIVDPAFYRGHREVDLAMAELFGGFPPLFRHAYEHAWPLQPGHEVRAEVYRLYYLLVHVNLFGPSYGPSTIQTLRSVLASG